MIKMRSMVRIHYGDDIHAKEEIHTKDEIFKSTAETLESFLVTSSTSPVPEITQLVHVHVHVHVPAWRQRQEEQV